MKPSNPLSCPRGIPHGSDSAALLHSYHTTGLLMDNDLIDLKIAVGIMTAQIASLSKIVEKQSKDVEDLIALANKGKGASWILIGMGGIAGAITSKLVTFLPLVIR